jgi:hypothetical protein
VGAAIDRQDDEVTEPRIDELARSLAEAINRGDARDRGGMRDRAIDVLKDVVETGGPRKDPPEHEGAEGPAGRAMNPFALGIPLLLVGPFLGFLFPPVGIILILGGLGTCAVGVALAIGRSLTANRRRKASD